MEGRMKIKDYEKYELTTTSAIETIAGFTKIVLDYNEAFKRELNYTIKIIDSDKEKYKCKVIFKIETNEDKQRADEAERKARADEEE